MRREGISFDEMDDFESEERRAGNHGEQRRHARCAEGRQSGDERAELAIDMYVYRVQKAIGSYYAAMTRTDAVVMTAGIGENSADLREEGSSAGSRTHGHDPRS